MSHKHIIFLNDDTTKNVSVKKITRHIRLHDHKSMSSLQRFLKMIKNTDGASESPKRAYNPSA